ncbi:hypothetical protein [Priestia aryabhattai]|uniref:hypothetical protein n=1 Tax=Priestia aryabhattai TaxID=412384 RepID=UPI000532EB3F|nr:hypothetical protein [Priestia aryabhattai]
MKKVLFYLFSLALLCIVSLTGCSLFDEKEKETSKQTGTEENLKDKESESEEKGKASKDEREKSNVETSETSNQVSSSKENSITKPKEAPKQATTSQVDWGDAWTRDIQFRHGLLQITDKGQDTFKFRIDATYSFDADAVRRGAVNYGEMVGTAKIEGNVATQTILDPYTDCRMKFVNHTTYVEVITLNACSPGGFNVYFDGDYKKGNIPEKEIPMEDDQVESDKSSEDTGEVENDESSEDTGEVENDESSEDTSGADEETGQYDENTDWDDGYTEEDDDGSITMEEAQSIVEDYLQPDSNHFVECSSITDGDYLFSYYADGEETAALLGIYGVNSETREVYKVQ